MIDVAAFSRGIHVLCEKPFALNVEEARQMKAAADRTPVVSMIDFEFRFVPARAYGRDLIRDNYLGEIRMADFIVHFGQRSEPADRPFDWWSEESSGGGLLGAFGSHAVDTLRLFLVGEPRRILGDLATFVKERDGRQITSDDGYNLIIEFKSGARAVVQMTLAAGVDDARMGIYGSQGQLLIPNIFGTELRGGKRSDKKSGPIEIPEKYRYPDDGMPLRGPFRILLGQMTDAIDNHQPSPSPNFQDALDSQILLDAARLSFKQGTWVDL